MTSAEFQAALANGKYKVREGKFIIPESSVARPEQKSSRKEEDDVVAPWPRAERPAPASREGPTTVAVASPCAWWKHPWAWAVFFVAGMVGVLMLAGMLA